MRSLRLVTPVALTATVVLVVSTLLATPARSATDVTPPALNVPPAVSFVVGGALTDTVTADTFYSHNIPVNVAWSGSDAGGICDYEVGGELAGGPTTFASVGPAVRSWRGTVTDYDGTFGGGSGVMVGLSVVAHDCAGNTTTKTAGSIVRIYSETGQSATDFPIPVSYQGAWGTSRCECWLGDAVRRTTARNASASFRVTVPANGHSVAVVTNTGPNRGVFDIRVDGVHRAAYNAYATAAAKKNSVIAWQAALSAGEHTITLVNRATAGRPRMDVDAVLVN